MAITNILLRKESHPDLVTKDERLTATEGDENIIEVYDSLKELERRNPEGKQVVDLPVEYNDAVGNKKYRQILVDGKLITQRWDTDTSAYVDIEEIDGSFRTKQILPVISDFACYKSSGSVQVENIDAATEASIDIVKIVGSDYFSLTGNTITIQNLPTGYYAIIEVILEVNLIKSGGTETNAGIEVVRLRNITTNNYFNLFELDGNYQVITKMTAFTINNGDEITFNIKNLGAESFEVSIPIIYARMNIVATKPSI